MEVKSRHWDKPLRELAARAAAALVPHHARYFAGPALDKLLPACLNDVLEVGWAWGEKMQFWLAAALQLL